MGLGRKDNMKENIIKRKDIRLKQYDYSRVGYYYITICTKNRECILSKIKNIKNTFITELTIEGNIVNTRNTAD